MSCSYRYKPRTKSAHNRPEGVQSPNKRKKTAPNKLRTAQCNKNKKKKTRPTIQDNNKNEWAGQRSKKKKKKKQQPSRYCFCDTQTVSFHRWWCRRFAPSHVGFSRCSTDEIGFRSCVMAVSYQSFASDVIRASRSQGQCELLIVRLRAWRALRQTIKSANPTQRQGNTRGARNRKLKTNKKETRQNNRVTKKRHKNKDK